MIKDREVQGLSKMLNSAKVEDILMAWEALGAIGDRHRRPNRLTDRL